MKILTFGNFFHNKFIKADFGFSICIQLILGDPKRAFLISENAEQRKVNTNYATVNDFLKQPDFFQYIIYLFFVKL